MVHSLHQFMFNTALHYSTLRPIVQLQHLNHALLNSSPVTNEEATAPVATTSPPAPPRKKRKKDDTRETQLALKIKGSELLQRATQRQFIVAGAIIGAVTSCANALKTPSRMSYTPPHSTGDSSYEVSWLGGWPLHQALPGRELNIVEYTHGQRQKHTRIRHLKNPVPLVDKLLNNPAQMEVTHRYYQGCVLKDTSIRTTKGGGYTVAKAVRDRHGKRTLFELDYSATGQPKRLLHFVNSGRDKHDLTPVGNDGHTWQYNGLEATYTFRAAASGEVAYYDVAPHKTPSTQWRVEVLEEPSSQKRRDFNTHARILQHDGSKTLKPVSEPLTNETLNILEHPIAFKQLVPAQNEGKNLLDSGFNALPKPLFRVNRFKFRQPSHFPEGLVRHYPWQEWVFKPLAFTLGLAVVANGLYELLFSSKSPFIRWLQSHVKYRETLNTPDILQRNKTETKRQVAYIKHTGSEQADADISNALEILSSLGVVHTKTIQTQ